ncbi:MAG: hypothetical protein IIC02_00960 [Planctomycetes bacterium]|nr:hypothetical protein [Planctomycetota bacterium]
MLNSLGLAIIVSATVFTQSAVAQSRIEAGQPFPELVLPALKDGSPASIAMYRGKKVVLHIFASW